MSKDNKKICMVIGDPVKHSLSPLIHNAGYKALGIDSEYEYTAENITPEDLQDFADKMRSQNIAGVSCTIPHKEAIIPYLDEIDDTAKSIGAVNTIVNKNGVLRGYNTDCTGAMEPLAKALDLKGVKAAVIGAGGAGKAFVYGLTNAGCKVTIYNRSLDKAKSLAIHFGCEFKPLSEQSDIKEADIICNTTSIGMDTDDTPVDGSNLHSGQVVFDIVYSPAQTRLLREAKAAGARTIPGTEMLLQQAFAQFKLFTGLDAPEQAMRQALMESLR
jgi:shikimate dehydrogenase